MPTGDFPPEYPLCPRCGNNRQVWHNQITGKLTCHRVGCYIEITSMTIHERIASYLGNGGLFNPEMMEHDKVRDLIMACRDEIATLRQERDRLRKTGDAMAEYLAPGPIPTSEPTDRDFLLADWEQATVPSKPKTVAEATGLCKGPALDLAESLYREGHTYLPPNLSMSKKGLLQKYRVTKADGSFRDPNAEYFVLRLDYTKHDSETDTAHVNACRAAVRQYAHEIEPWLPELARELRDKYPMPASAIGQPIAPGKEHDGHR